MLVFFFFFSPHTIFPAFRPHSRRAGSLACWRLLVPLPAAAILEKRGRGASRNSPPQASPTAANLSSHWRGVTSCLAIDVPIHLLADLAVLGNHGLHDASLLLWARPGCNAFARAGRSQAPESTMAVTEEPWVACSHATTSLPYWPWMLPASEDEPGERERRGGSHKNG